MKVKTKICVLHAIQTIIEKNNLMEMLMENASVRMVIMIIIKAIVYAYNVQHFGKFGNLLFFYSTICSYNIIDDKVICTKC